VTLPSSQIDGSFVITSDISKTLRKRFLGCFAVIITPLLALVISSCFGGGDGDDTSSSSPEPGYAGACLDAEPGTSNTLQNGGFEEGAEPWITLADASGFQVSTEQVHSGENSALLRMRDPAEAAEEKVYYLVQEVRPDEFPEVVCGYYRVENWKKGSLHQYLQAVAIVFAPANLPTTYPNYQIRYLLAGADSPPFSITNGKFVFVTREDPKVGEWVPFELNLREDFEELWGQVPEGYEFVRLLFEVRWDNKVAGEAPAEADAFYDDLFAGPR
jgi:hypothetical protein